MDSFRRKMLDNFLTWKESHINALITDDITITYAELYKLVCGKVNQISEKNVIMALCNVNGIPFIVDLMAILISGNVPLIIPPYLSDDDIIRVMSRCNAIKYINSDISGLVKNEDEECLKNVILENDVAIIMFSSGTTSDGKMIPISYESLFYRITYTNKYFVRREACSELFFMPLSSAAGLQHQLFPCLTKKCTIVLYEGVFNPRKIVNLISKYHISYLSMVPSLFKSIYQYCIKRNENLEDIDKIFICGEKIDADFLQKAFEYFKGIDLVQAYGMSEMLPVSMHLYKSKEEIVENSVGEVLEEVKVKIIDKDIYGVGEICILGRNMINRYWSSTKRFQWIQTGDIGYIDENRVLYILGRKKNMVIINGNNIYTEEIERNVELYPGIVEAKAYGIRDKLRGEAIVLQIKPDDGYIIDVKELRKYLCTKLSVHSVPFKIQIVNEIEKNYNYKKKR